MQNERNTWQKQNEFFDCCCILKKKNPYVNKIAIATETEYTNSKLGSQPALYVTVHFKSQNNELWIWVSEINRNICRDTFLNPIWPATAI